MNILLLGGSGFIGRNVCEKLVETSGGGEGRVTVPSRNPQRAKHIQTLPTIELARADVHNETQLAALVSGRDAVINLVGILHGSQTAFQQAHVEFPKKLARACQAVGTKRVIHVSALGADANAPSRYLRSKAEGEAALRDANLALTVLRPSVVFGEGDAFMNLFARLQSVFLVMPLAGAGAKFQPVWVEDLAQAIVNCLRQRETIGQTIECVGPRIHTLEQLVRDAGRWSGHARPIIALPSALASLQALLLECLPGEPLMSRDNLDSMKVDSVASGALPRLDSLGIRPAAVDAVMPELLGQRAGPARLDVWRQH